MGLFLCSLLALSTHFVLYNPWALADLLSVCASQAGTASPFPFRRGSQLPARDASTHFYNDQPDQVQKRRHAQLALDEATKQSEHEKRLYDQQRKRDYEKMKVLGNDEWIPEFNRK